MKTRIYAAPAVKELRVTQGRHTDYSYKTDYSENITVIIMTSNQH